MSRAVPLRLLGLVALIGLLLGACRQAADPPAATAGANLPTRPAVLAPLPTLYPTATSALPPTPTSTRPPVAAAPTPTPIDFDQVVVYMRYAIPSLGLDRVLEGNVASQITLRDEAGGAEESKSNQAAVLLELQSALDGLVLEPVPDDCTGCVFLEYQLPLAGQAGAGWLQSAQLLASVENFFAANLGPHYPPGTVAGLRRSAANTDAAHTVAVDGDGTVWRWTAIEPLVAGGQGGLPAGSRILEAAAGVEPAGLDGARFWLDCPGKPLEWLRLSGPDGAPVDARIRCPELTLPTTLVPLYAALDGGVAPLLSGEVLPPAVAPRLPLTRTLYFESPGGAVTLGEDGVARLAAGVISGTVPLSSTFAVSLTLAISETAALPAPDIDLARRGLVTDTATLDDYVLLLRTDDGVGAATWSDAPPAGIGRLVTLLNDLLALLLEQLGAPPPPPTATPAPDGTPPPDPAPTVSTTPTATPPPTSVP